MKTKITIIYVNEYPNVSEDLPRDTLMSCKSPSRSRINAKKYIESRVFFLNMPLKLINKR